jgi:hypothetical protein
MDTIKVWCSIFTGWFLSHSCQMNNYQLTFSLMLLTNETYGVILHDGSIADALKPEI